jgi:hypothetical protein
MYSKRFLAAFSINALVAGCNLLIAHDEQQLGLLSQHIVDTYFTTCQSRGFKPEKLGALANDTEQVCFALSQYANTVIINTSIELDQDHMHVTDSSRTLKEELLNAWLAQNTSAKKDTASYQILDSHTCGTAPRTCNKFYQADPITVQNYTTRLTVEQFTHYIRYKKFYLDSYKIIIS